MEPVQKLFFKQDAVAVAQKLLGKVVSCDGCSGIIVETEAYKADPASHAYKITPRSEIMLKTYGCWYIYFVYGMYYCMNITTNGLEEPGAVLIRALEPMEGIPKMKQRRKTDDINNLCSGPGKLCCALAIDKTFNGSTIAGQMKLFHYKDFPESQIKISTRIGIKEKNPLPWRFFVKGNRFVSKAIT